MATDSPWLIAGWISLHLAAFLWACGTRVVAGSRLEGLAHLGFYFALAAVGAAAFFGEQVDVGWVWSAMTFMAMVITAVVDFRHVGEAARASVRC